MGNTMLSRQERKERSAAARRILGEVYGKNRISVRCGTGSEGEDNTHWLNVRIRIRKEDPRTDVPFANIRREVVSIFREAGFRLYETSYPPSHIDSFALSLEILR